MEEIRRTDRVENKEVLHRVQETQRTRRRERKRKQLPYVIKELTGYCKMKEEAIDRSVWELALIETMDLLQDRL